jgi:hypothetical protein
MSELATAVEAAERAIGQRITDWPGHVIHQAAAYAIASAAPLIEAQVRARVAEEIALHLEAIHDAPDRPLWAGTPFIEETLTFAAKIAREHAKAVA